MSQKIFVLILVILPRNQSLLQEDICSLGLKKRPHSWQYTPIIGRCPCKIPKLAIFSDVIENVITAQMPLDLSGTVRGQYYKPSYIPGKVSVILFTFFPHQQRSPHSHAGHCSGKGLLPVLTLTHGCLNLSR